MIYSHANLIKAWPTTLNLALSNSQSWLYSFASRRTLGVYRHQEVAGSCDTQTVQTCFSAYCFSDCSMRQTNSSCYQWLRDVIIDTVNSDDDSDLLYKCPTMEVVWRLQLSFATPCTKCVCVCACWNILFFFFFLAAVHKAEYWKHLLAGVITVHFYANISSCAKCSRTCNN